MKMVKVGGMVLPLVLCAAMQASAATTVIDFEELSNSTDQLVIGESYAHYVSADQSEYYLVQATTPSLTVYGTQADYGYTGSAALMNDNRYGFTTLSYIKDDTDNLFSISSIDVWEIATASAYDNSAVTFYGMKENGSMVEQSFAINGVFDSQTFLFGSSFTDLVSVMWKNPAESMQIDNINVSPSAVPVPSSMLLFGTVLTALAAAGKSRRKLS